MLTFPALGCRPGPCAWFARGGLAGGGCPTFLEVRTSDINNYGLSVEFRITVPSRGNPGNPTCVASGPYLSTIANYPGRVAVDVWGAWRDRQWVSSVEIRVFAGYRYPVSTPQPVTIFANPGTFTPFLPPGQSKAVFIPGNVTCPTYPQVATVTVFDDGTFTLA